MPNSAKERRKSKPLTAPRVPTRKYWTRSLAKMRVATINANTPDTMDPQSTAISPARASSTAASWASAPPPTLSTSAHATPSGYGKSDWVTRARRRGIEYITPSIPPSPQIEAEIQYGKPFHQPMITRPGSTKMIADRVPAAEAMVWTTLFSWMVIPLNPRRMAMEMTAAGMEVAKVSPALRPKKTLAAVNTRVIRTPRMTPRSVSSFCTVVVMDRSPPRKSLSRTLHRHAVPLRSKNGRLHGLRTGPVPVPSGGAVRCPTCYVVAQAPRLLSLSQGAGCWSLPQTPRLLSLPQPPRLASLPETPVLQKYA